MARIFLCHASEDKARVEEIYHRLEGLGFQPWMDKMDLLPGQWWQHEIPQALRASDFIMIFFSRNSVAKRGYVQREFKLALDTSQDMPENQIYTIPIRLDDCNIPSQFNFLQWCNVFEEDGFEKLVQAIRVGLSQRQRQESGVPLEEIIAPKERDQKNLQVIQDAAQQQQDSESASQQGSQKRRDKENKNTPIEHGSLPYLSPASFIKAAQAAHPAFKFAIVIAGLAAIVAVVLRFGSSPATLIFGTIVLVFSLVLFVVYAQIAAIAKAKLTPPALVLIWSFLLVAIITAALLFTSAFFNEPFPLKTAILPSASNALVTAMEFYNRGNAKLNKQDYQEALADYTKAITHNPKHADAYYLRGLARVELHDYQAALADYRKAADLYQQQEKTSDYQDTLRRIEELQ